MLKDSPTVDAICLAAALRRRMPPHFGPYIQSAMWASIGDYYIASGGRCLPDSILQAMPRLCPILCVCPMREMALLC